MASDTNSDDMVVDPSWSRDEAREEPVRDACVWCKAEADPEERVELGTQEREYICATCLGDLREFKRYTLFDPVISDGLKPRAIRELKLAIDQAVRQLEEIYVDDPEVFRISERISNAVEYNERHEPPRPTGDRDTEE